MAHTSVRTRQRALLVFPCIALLRTSSRVTEAIPEARGGTSDLPPTSSADNHAPSAVFARSITLSPRAACPLTARTTRSRSPSRTAVARDSSGARTRDPGHCRPTRPVRRISSWEPALWRLPFGAQLLRHLAPVLVRHGLGIERRANPFEGRLRHVLALAHGTLTRPSQSVTTPMLGPHRAMPATVATWGHRRALALDRDGPRATVRDSHMGAGGHRRPRASSGGSRAACRCLSRSPKPTRCGYVAAFASRNPREAGGKARRPRDGGVVEYRGICDRARPVAT